MILTYPYDLEFSENNLKFQRKGYGSDEMIREEYT